MNILGKLPVSRFHLPSPFLSWSVAGVLLVLTGWGTTTHFSWTMMALATFSLAYVSKGWRKRK